MTLPLQFVPELPIPIVFNHAYAQLPELLAANYRRLPELLSHHGALLFRGFSCEHIDLFSKAIAACQLGVRCDTRDYQIPRTQLAHDIYTSNDLPAPVMLPLHHEKPRSQHPPHHLYFCCITPASIGGATLFADARILWQETNPAIQHKIKQHGVMYQQFLHGRSWRSTLLARILGKTCVRYWTDYFQTEQQSIIEQRLAQETSSWHWCHQKTDLVLQNRLPGVRPHPISHELLWFNSAAYLNYFHNLTYGTLKQLRSLQYLAAQYLMNHDMLPLICHYGNGQAFSFEEIVTINHLMEKHTWHCYWQRGDFMIVDNYTLMHGKEPHQGQRLLYSCMTENRPHKTR